MARLKGIMINGEWLGERVIVNNCFRSICAISPTIMLEAVRLINKIEYKRDVFEVKGFEFISTDTIQICFEGKKLKGIIDLTFGIANSELYLKSSFLDIKPINEKAQPKYSLKEFIEEKPIIAKEQNFTDIEKKNESSIEINKTDISEESLKGDIVLDDLVALPQGNDEDVSNNVALENNATILDQEIPNVKTSEETIVSEKNNKDDVVTVNELKKDLVQKTVILDADTLLSKLEKYNVQDEQNEKFLEKKSYVNELKTATEEQNCNGELDQNKPQNSDEIIKIEQEDNPIINKLEEESSKSKLNTKSHLENVEQSISKQFEFGEKNIDDKKNKVNIISGDEVVEEIEDRNENNDIDFDEEYNFSNDQAQINAFDEDLELEYENELIQTDFVYQDLDNVEKIIEKSNNIEEAINSEKNKVNEHSCEELCDESAEKSLIDFYFVEDTVATVNIEKDADELLEDDVVVQAMLSEMVALKEELDFLKNSPLKNDFKEAFWNERKNNKTQVIADEDADFKILSTNEKINAAILDNDSFFAGEKIYKWGDTLYLNE